MKHLSSDNQQVIEKLASHPKLLFGYMKGIMDARPGGNNSSGMENSVISLHGKHKERLSNRQQSVSGRFSRVDQWEPNVDIRDLLQRSGVAFTDDMAELYVEVNLTCFLKQGLELISQSFVRTVVVSPMNRFVPVNHFRCVFYHKMIPLGLMATVIIDIFWVPTISS